MLKQKLNSYFLLLKHFQNKINITEFALVGQGKRYRKNTTTYGSILIKSFVALLFSRQSLSYSVRMSHFFHFALLPFCVLVSILWRDVNLITCTISSHYTGNYDYFLTHCLKSF
jgi:hypothetical protein